MKKEDIIEQLLEIGVNESETELKKMKKDELEELLEANTDESSMYPNGRDHDAEEF